LKYIVALDQGTTSSRAIVFDENQNTVAQVQKEFTQIYPKPGYVEHDPMEIYTSQYEVFTEALKISGVAPGDIAAIGVANQRETTILWDRHTGKPVCNAIVWQCRRTYPYCEELKNRGLATYIKETTGLVIDAYFSATKIMWILDNIPGVRAKAETGDVIFGTVDTWLIWNLSEGRAHVTDCTNASRTMLYNINTLSWDEKLLSEMNIPRAILPEVISSAGVCATVKVMGREIPIAGVAGDQQAALFGQQCFLRGDAKNTYGTGCFLLMNTGDKPVISKSGLITTIAISLGAPSSPGGLSNPDAPSGPGAPSSPGGLSNPDAPSGPGGTRSLYAPHSPYAAVAYALEGSVFTGGAVIQWLRDELKVINTAAESERCALSVSDSNGVYIVPAFSGLGAPHWDMQARGALFGVTSGTDSNHLVRAALESIAYQTKDVLDAMQADTGIELRELNTDGGASANDFLMQFQADILNKDVLRPETTEATALGAAYLAGLATGIWRDIDELRNRRKIEHRFTPDMNPQRRDALLSGWERAVRLCRQWKQVEG